MLLKVEAPMDPYFLKAAEILPICLWRSFYLFINFDFSKQFMAFAALFDAYAM